ncbi:MAG: hypothetical protein IJR72_03255 [Oscillospiraceae bacterium]|nr:hypothetical protein [Oscillospiraceae bacterium]
MQEDTKPKNDIQDKEPKKPFSRSEYHGVITSYAGLALSLIAIILSVITMYQSHAMQTREIVQILRAEDDGYYHFDGETLFKNYQVTVANNSAIPVSVVEITVERDGEARTFEISDLPDILPLNMDANHTEMITIPWEIELSAENAQEIKRVFTQDSSKESEEKPFKPDTIYPSRGTILELDDISDTSPKNEDTLSDNIWAGNCYGMLVITGDTISDNHWFGNCYSMTTSRDILFSAKFQEIPFSVTVFTSKNHQFSWMGNDQKPDAQQWENEGAWVTRHIRVSTLNDFIEALKAAQARNSDSSETSDVD